MAECIAVTGAAGYLGRALVTRLLSEPGVDVVKAFDLHRLHFHPDEPDLESIEMDINDPGLGAVLGGVDTLCHLAFVIDSDASDAHAWRVNIEGTRAVLEASLDAGVGRIVVASSVSAYGAKKRSSDALLDEAGPLLAGPGFRYAYHKVLVERMLDGFERAHPEIAVVRLRIATVLGPPPRSGAITALLRSRLLALPSGFHVQFVHVHDVADAFVLAACGGAGGAYNVAAHPPLSARQIAAITGQVLVGVPDPMLGVISRLLDRIPVRDPDRMAFLRYPVLVSCARIQDHLGWSARYHPAQCIEALMR